MCSRPPVKNKRDFLHYFFIQFTSDSDFSFLTGVFTHPVSGGQGVMFVEYHHSRPIVALRSTSGACVHFSLGAQLGHTGGPSCPPKTVSGKSTEYESQSYVCI